MPSYFAQLLPDHEGCVALRKLMNAVITAKEEGMSNMAVPHFTSAQLDSLYAVYAKLTLDMRNKE